MKAQIIKYASLIGLLVIIISCLDKKDIVGTSTHPDGWLQRSSDQFHGDAVHGNLGEAENCQSCHGDNYGGGTSEVSCYNSECHSSYPHKDGFININSPNFHSDFIKDVLDRNIEDCQVCHGTDYTGGTAQVNCYTCHSDYPHKDGYASGTSLNSHASFIKDSLSWVNTNCQSCHGTELTGGSSEVSCFQCHTNYPHSDGFENEASPNFHGDYIINDLNWDMTFCQSCHGTDYAGNSSTEKNCNICHTEPGGPEACNTCHGNSVNAAPPSDLAGNESTSFTTVGAHQKHLTGTTWTTNLLDDCSVCHTEVVNFSDAGHINDGTEHSEIVFNSLSTDGGNMVPIWDRGNNTCSNTYCHGDNAVDWTNVGSQEAACGTCHGLPPTTAHPPSTITQCVNCHSLVVNSGAQIINKALHINGVIDRN